MSLKIIDPKSFYSEPRSKSVLGLLLLSPIVPTLSLMVLAFGLAGCVSPPIGASHVSTRVAHRQVEANALNAGKLSDYSEFILHRYDLGRLAAKNPAAALAQLHEKAVVTGERDQLFTLSELSYMAAERLRHSVRRGEPQLAPDYYLGSAVYAYLFLFGDSKGEKPDGFDRRFRMACDFLYAPFAHAPDATGK